MQLHLFKKIRLVLVLLIINCLQSYELSHLIKKETKIPGIETASISGKVEGMETGNIKISLWDTITSTERSIFSPHREIFIPVIEGKFNFIIHKVKGVSYFCIGEDIPSSDFGLKYMIGPGDNLKFTLDQNKKIKFDSSSSTKMNCISDINASTFSLGNEFDRLQRRGNETKRIVPNTSAYDKFYAIAGSCSYVLSNQLLILDKFKKTIDKATFEIIRANLIGANLKRFLYGFQILYLTSKSEKEFLKDNYNKFFDTLKVATISNSIAFQSDNYAAYSISKLRTDRTIDTSVSIYNQIVSKFPDPLKEKLIVIYFSDYFEYIPNVDDALDSAIIIVKDKFFKQQLIELSSTMRVGVKAYDFTLPDVKNKMISLSNYKDKVVFIDFWFTGCGGCAIYYKNVVHPIEQKFEKDTNVVFIAICLDKSREMWINSIKENKYTNENVINLYTAGNGYNDSVVEKYKIQAAPRPILIDKRGYIFNSSEVDLREESKLVSLIKEALNE